MMTAGWTEGNLTTGVSSATPGLAALMMSSKLSRVAFLHSPVFSGAVASCTSEYRVRPLNVNSAPLSAIVLST